MQGTLLRGASVVPVLIRVPIRAAPEYACAQHCGPRRMDAAPTLFEGRSKRPCRAASDAPVDR